MVFYYTRPDCFIKTRFNSHPLLPSYEKDTNGNHKQTLDFINDYFVLDTKLTDLYTH